MIYNSKTSYGSYTTIDTPTAYQSQAFNFLQKEFEKIGGVVRTILNAHDLGTYPSFEVDYPLDIEELAEIEDGNEEVEQWHQKADDIVARYNKKFEKWL